MRVAFRLDANPAIGLGHLMRCLALADALSRAGAECHFLCHELSEALTPRLTPHRLHSLGNADDLAPLATLRPDWLVVDHYGLDADWERRAAPLCGRLMVIDDLADRPHQADVLLDQGPLRQEADYAPRLNPGCRLLLGTRFALLRPAFRALAKHGAVPWRRGLICFGGADPAGACLSTLQSLALTPWITRLSWTLVAGGANPHWAEIAAWCQAHPDITLLRESHQMAALMAEHDLAIGAAGGMTWERACLGLPTLAVPIVDNQVFNDEVITHYRLAERLTLPALHEPRLLDEALTRLHAEAEGYRQRAQALVDGLGLARLCAIMLQPADYGLHPVGSHWAWRNPGQPPVPLTLIGNRLRCDAPERLDAAQWRELAHALLAFLPDPELALETPPPCPAPAPWRADWHLGQA